MRSHHVTHATVPGLLGLQTLVKEAIALMREKGFDQLPIVSPARKPIGLVTLGNLMSLVSSGRMKITDEVSASFRL